MIADTNKPDRIADAVSKARAIEVDRSQKLQRIVKPRRIRLHDRTEYRNRRRQLDRADAPAIIWSDGTTEWWRKGRRHRDGGPAIEAADGAVSWFKDGKLHRDDGPAYADRQGNEEWWRDGKLHRLDDPALSHRDGLRLWCVDGHLHREDGPAAIRADGTMEYWFRGHRLAPEGGQSREVAGCKIWFSCGRITIVEECEAPVLQDPSPPTTPPSPGKAARLRHKSRTHQPTPGKGRRIKP